MMGTIFTWSVPFFTSSCKQTYTATLDNNATGSNHLEEEAKELDSILKWPLRGPHTVDTSSEILGICSCIFGDSTLWMNGVNTTNKNEICIGSVPSSTFGNVLYSGQDCRKMNQNIVGTKRIVIDLFGLSNCTIAAPAYSVSLLSLLLQCNSSFAQHEEKQQKQKKVKQIIRCHILQSLSTFHDDSMATALKVLVLRSIEYLSEIMSFHSSNEYSDNNLITSEEKKVEFARSLLEEIISLAKLSLNELHFAALFLGIGRQIEPHHFNLLFPLRLSPVYMDTELTPRHLSSLEDITVEDLFDISLRKGSVCIAASALPMFSCKYDSHLKCIELLKTCLEDISSSSSSSLSSSNNFEEKYVLQQLFQFGIKLEEAGRPYSTANSVASTPVDDDNLTPDNNNIISDMNYDSDLDDDEEDNSSKEEKKQDGLLSKIPSIRNILTTPSKVWKSRAEEKKKEETEIQNAAADFIMAGFDDDHPPNNNKKNNTQLLHGIDDSYLSDNETSQLTITDYVPYECFIAVNGSISGVVCKYILKTIFANPTRSRQRYRKWNQIASIAELLVGDLYDQYFYSSYNDDKKSDLTRILNEALNGVLSPTLLSNLLNTNVYENSVDILIKNCFMKLISECEEQIGSLKAGIVFELIIVLLLQYDHCEYIRSSRAELATVGIVAGHVSGKLIGVLEGNSTWTFTPLGSSYLSAAEIYEA